MGKRLTEGPVTGWGAWRKSRDAKIAKPKRSRYQILMAKAEKEKAKQSAKEAVK
jgi:hypothetical protein